MTIEEEYLISEYMIWNFEDIKYRAEWDDIFEVANRIESQDGYVLIMQHNTFLFKDKLTGEQIPIQTYFSEPDQRINAAHECLVKMIKYINSLKSR